MASRNKAKRAHSDFEERQRLVIEKAKAVERGEIQRWPEPHPDSDYYWLGVKVGIRESKARIQREWEKYFAQPFPGWTHDALTAVAAFARLAANAIESESPFTIYRKAIEKQKAKAPPKADSAVFLGNGRYQVGADVICLVDAQKDVLQGLVDLRAASLADLKKHCGVNNPAAVLKAIVKRHPNLGRFIKLPGGKGKGGYSTAIVDSRERVSKPTANV